MASEPVLPDIFMCSFQTSAAFFFLSRLFCLLLLPPPQYGVNYLFFTPSLWLSISVSEIPIRQSLHAQLYVC